MLDSSSTLSSQAESIPAVPDALLEQVQSVLMGAEPSASRIVRVTVPADGETSPLRWIQGQERSEALYWSGRDEARAVVGLGAADVVATNAAPLDYSALQARIDERLHRASAPVRYYGGVRFDARRPRPSTAPDSDWAPYGTARFVLPRIERGVTGDRQWWACNLVLPRDAEQPDALLAALRAQTRPARSVPPSLPSPVDRTDSPPRARWTRMVQWALEAIGEGGLSKVVLARRVALELGEAVDPFRILRHLAADTPDCFHFAVQPGASTAFVGASPERLLRREWASIESEAVAGTRSRGDSARSDAALRDELMGSAKERREHAFVQEAIRDRLDALCTDVQGADTPSDLTLSRRRHLHAPLTGTLRDDVTTADVLAALHPTPAVGGVPTDAALEAIQAQEPFDRGWYAGPVGWIGDHEAEFAVGIRAGLVHETRLTLFSGAGIVDGSVPEREWDEIEQKIGDFAAILGVSEAPDGA